MKTCYIVTENNEPLTKIVLTNEYLFTESKNEDSPIIFKDEMTAKKIALALSWVDNSWDFGWEKVYV